MLGDEKAAAVAATAKAEGVGGAVEGQEISGVRGSYMNYAEFDSARFDSASCSRV